mmetsp:Transcript_34483/g.83437  ORF Transcript_34483/g.83437 Transcript_34483/m.83437 type:complete len:83 (-) Transcript_34483:585-833(-)
MRQFIHFARFFIQRFHTSQSMTQQRLTALASLVVPGANLNNLDRMSPTAGPPSTRTISAVDPPSSVTGKTCHTFVPPAVFGC